MLGIAGLGSAASSQAGTTNYFSRGILKEIKADEHQLVITHEKIPGLMEAMTMPFRVKDHALLKKAAAGEKIIFQLHLSESESWIDHIERAGTSGSGAGTVSTLAKSDSQAEAKSKPAASGESKNPLRTFKFTNELGQPVSLSDFHGQAIALTFFFTRCPIPEFCPRLARNFEAVQARLKAMSNAPTNWHLLSITFDPEHDTPQALKAYAELYQYDPIHWSFLTGPKDKIAELARLCDVQFTPEKGFLNHNFRTLIIDASNRLQMVFPTSGNISDAIVEELLKAASATNRVADPPASYVRAESHEN